MTEVTSRSGTCGHLASIRGEHPDCGGFRQRHVGSLIGQRVRSWEPAPEPVVAIVSAIKRRGLDLPTETESDAAVNAAVAVALHHVVAP